MALLETLCLLYFKSGPLFKEGMDALVSSKSEQEVEDATEQLVLTRLEKVQENGHCPMSRLIKIDKFQLYIPS